MTDQTDYPSVMVAVLKVVMLVCAFVATIVAACAIATVLTR